jgi:hypothetical protein
MPYFNFDLVIGEDFKNQGGMILEDTEIAIDKAGFQKKPFHLRCQLDGFRLVN